ncbi:hypothetical protein NP233_g5413 [Leucocoprinus birnbaumii]|uniref:Uncharacterized protein n=1 Tax=Leucocoprinus birnbaumii TaxID=56174 RepID=A0AAD5VVJ4_9AGAR|nr:hypothetical protein NP233_g5413 [Leucocoprinus birnbaumii]
MLYPLLAYMMEVCRTIHPQHEEEEKCHVAITHHIVNAPPLRRRRGSPSMEPLHHTTTLQGAYSTQADGGRGWCMASTLPRGPRGSQAEALRVLNLYQQCIRELSNLELVVATSLVLLSELYTAYDPVPEEDITQKLRFCLTCGKTPVADFGICKGKIRGTKNRLQVYTYHDLDTDTHTSYQDPDNYYWIYFRTLTGEEFSLDCCSFSFGMEGCVDASHCIPTFPADLRVEGSSRVPAYLRSSHDDINQYPYVLIKRKALFHPGE